MIESKVWVVAEALDAIMDIYAEDDSDQLATEIELVTRLRTVLPHFKNKVTILFYRTFKLHYFMSNNSFPNRYDSRRKP